MIDIIEGFDNFIFDFIGSIHNSFLDNIMIFITRLGDCGFIWILICLGLIISKKYRKFGLILGLALIIESILGEVIIKNIVQRTRPFSNMENLKLLITPPNSFSFPSGYTASSITSGIILVHYLREKGIPFFILALLISFSRVYLFMHYPSDIIGGILLGILSAYTSIIFGKKILDLKVKNK